MRKLAPFVAIVAVLHAQPLHADRGLISLTPGVRLFEPNQRAIIAWNGHEEILVLSTDLRASRPTKVLEILPLPAEPAVKKGDPEVFKKATALINSRRPTIRHQVMGAVPGGRSDGPAGEVTFHERIGAHDVSVTHALDGEAFFDWAEDYLRSLGADTPMVPPSMRFDIRKYIEAGYTWFVYDVVEVAETIQTIDPIQYRFKSDSVFYPLKITRTHDNRTRIELLILTPELLSEFPALPRDRVHLPHEPITITQHELRDLNAEMDGLLGHRPNMKLRIWNILGRGKPFRRDLVAR